jgi:hypothetical protein
MNRQKPEQETAYVWCHLVTVDDSLFFNFWTPQNTGEILKDVGYRKDCDLEWHKDSVSLSL